MASTVDWNGEKVIMLADVPVNFLIKSYALGKVGEWGKYAATALGAFQYYYYASLVEDGGLVNTSNAWDALSALGTTAMGIIVFKETMTKREWIATALILSGLYIMAK